MMGIEMGVKSRKVPRLELSSANEIILLEKWETANEPELF